MFVRAWLTALLSLSPVLFVLPVAADEPAVDDEGVSGRELFVREWIAGDPRSHGGDGLGPVFNGSSCAACHNQGGIGGAGGFDENVHLLSVTFANVPTKGRPGAAEIQKRRERSREELARNLHPDFAKQDTIVVHRFGGELHEAWRRQLQTGRFRANLTPDTFPQPEPPSQPFDPPAFESTSSLPSVSIPLEAPAEAAPPLQFVAAGQVFAEGGFDDAAFDDDGFQPATPIPAQQAVSPGRTFRGAVLSPLPTDNNQSFPILNGMQQRLNDQKAAARSGTASSFAMGFAVLQSSQRNTTALWGTGAIDRIDEKTIEALAAVQQEAGGRVSGRLHRLPDGRIGRFGWKAQKASLYDFTMAACAVELGLEVPGEKQSVVPYDRDYEPVGLDLTKHEVGSLVDYVASLPQPERLESSNAELSALLKRGETHFTTVGCAACHVPDVGEVRGVFTDLLLHDMGPDLGSVGSYGVPSVPEPDPDGDPIANAPGKKGPAKAKSVPPTSREWRTPPLWGVRDSAPYLHDGRARTLEQAIAFHGGEAAETRLRFAMLEPSQRAEMLAFLKSLVAPGTR